MKREYQYISYCGKYYCAMCDYRKGTIVKSAKNYVKESPERINYHLV